MAISDNIKSYFVFVILKVHPKLLDINLSANKKMVKILKEKDVIKFIMNEMYNKIIENMNVKRFNTPKVQFK